MVEQCPFVVAHGDDGYLCCALDIGHEGPHRTVYGTEQDDLVAYPPHKFWYLPQEKS